MNRKVHALCLLAITASTLFLFGSLIDRYGFNSHESMNIYIRTQQYAAEILAGHIPPQAYADAYFGAGYAFPRFYPPVTCLISVALSLAVKDYMLGVNLAFFLSALLSAYAFYFMGCKLTGNRWVSMAGTLLYISFPYRSAVLYIRGAMAECWTFMWYPLIVAGIWSATKERRMPWYLPFAIGGLILTHNITALYFFILCALLGLLVLWREGWATARYLLLGALLGGLLSCWFVLPQQYYLPTVWVSDIRHMEGDLARFHANRVPLSQLFSAAAPSLYNTTRPGILGVADLTFPLGAGQLVMIPCILLYLKKRREQAGDSMLIGVGAILAALWVVGLAFILYPRPFFSVLPRQFAYIQFPWRLMGQIGFFSTSAFVIFAAALRLPEKWHYLMAGVAALVVLVVPWHQRTKFTTEWTNRLVEPEIIRSYFMPKQGRFGYTIHSEYVPKEIDIEGKIDLKIVDAGFFREVRVEGDMNIIAFHKNGLEIAADLEARSDGRITLPLFYYDFYRATRDGGGRLATSSDRGFLAVSVPAGARALKVEPGVTAVSKAGIAMSAAAFLAIIAMLVRRRWRMAHNGQMGSAAQA